MLYLVRAYAHNPHFPWWNESLWTSSLQPWHSWRRWAGAVRRWCASSRGLRGGPGPPAAGRGLTVRGIEPSMPDHCPPASFSGQSSWPRWAPAADGCTAQVQHSRGWPLVCSSRSPEMSPGDFSLPPISSALCLTSLTWWRRFRLWWTVNKNTHKQTDQINYLTWLKWGKF